MQELSLNILDVANNSIRANASLVEITITENWEQNRLTLMIGDNGCGMTEEQLRQVRDPFFTTRTTRSVGLGVPLLQMSAELCGGSLTIDSTLDVGTHVTAVYQLDHLDRMPLGDMASTFCTLMQCNPQIAFVYHHTAGGGSFAVDTREFSEILGDLPLSSAPVLEFVRSMIVENLAELGSRA